jgi:phosphatidylserine/phosphatidylglycerophosphate/cardiolipin synthase-like enzyme
VTSPARTGAAQSPLNAGELLVPGRNCWRIERSSRTKVVQDAAEYFELVRLAVLRARRSVFVLGWDILANLDLVPGGAADGQPTCLAPLLNHIVRQRRGLECFVLVWDHSALYALERDPLTRIKLGWLTHRRVHFRFDDQHPIAASHHTKLVVVDDTVAFCGGIDLTTHRWDTVEHRVDEPLRVNSVGRS